VILWRDEGAGGGPSGREIMLVRRGLERRFAGGFHAFPGGRVDPEDGATAVEGASGEAARLVACAARELFEETGVLVARGAERVARPVREEVRRALLAGELPLGRAIERLGVRLSAEPFAPAGRWVTPGHFPLRYDARLFAVRLPPGEEPEVWPGELSGGAMTSARAALGRWARGEILLYPPNLHGVRTVAREGPLDLAALRAPPREATDQVEFQQGFFLVALRTPTLPPATHTNAWVVPCGDGVALLDPGAHEAGERTFLARALEGLGVVLREVWLTHAHADHVGAVAEVVRRFAVPVRAHPLAQDRVPVPVVPTREGELLGGRFRVLETPGHAREHLCFLDEETGALLAGDMVSTLSTIVIDPPEGDMAEYERQLERLGALEPRTLYPAHGLPAPDGGGALARLREHRRERERLVVAALASGGGTLEEVTRRAYSDTPAAVHPVAARSCLAVLEKLRGEGRASLASGTWR
jgi:glyoxylase-like metal-dependent hydrolase (beta-lactamase superfamily II)/8-oxo-dGTP pyrophosphatase MutT (NUDIX family)